MATSVLAAIQYAQQLAQTDAFNIGSVFGLSLYNDATQTFDRDLREVNIDAAQIQEAYTDITTNTPNTYPWPADMYKLKTIEINYQDQNQQNYLQAMPVDVSNIQIQSFDWLRANQSQTQPLFDNRGDTFEIFPNAVAANARGIRIFYYLTTQEATDVGQAINYPYTLDYRALSCMIAARYYKTQNDVEMAQVYEAEYNTRMQKIIRNLAPASEQPIQTNRLAMTGWNF